MKKILFVSDGANFPQGAFRFIKLLHENEPVFFSPIDFLQLSEASLAVSGSYLDIKEDEKAESNKRFAGLCEDHGIKFHIHHYHKEWNMDWFIRESRFADIVVISEELFCSNMYEEQPNSFMREALHNAECAVVVIPEAFQTLDRLLFTYDGNKESVLALKQFVYLLPQFTDLPAEFVYASNDETEDIPNISLLQEYITHHFNYFFTSKLNFDPKKYFSTWFQEKKNTVLVAGSYSRSEISNFLKKSFTDDVIYDHVNPVFLAH